MLLELGVAVALRVGLWVGVKLGDKLTVCVAVEVLVLDSLGVGLADIVKVTVCVTERVDD